jgi:transcription elongation GreA/GreB family factor
MTQDLNSLEKQIKQSKLDLDELYRLQSIKDTPPTVQEGALVQLGSDWFLLAVSVGQVKVDDKQVFLLSKNSPLGELLLGKKKNEAIQFRGKPQTITELV